MQAFEHFHHCARCGAGRTGDTSNPYHCSACGFTYHFNTASAVAVFIEAPDGRCLFIRRAREPSAGKLALAGGFTDAGETGEEATRREIREEVGLELGELTYVGSWPNFYQAGGFTVPVLDLFFRAPLASETVTLARDEVSGIEWLHPLDVALEDLAFPSMRSAVAAYRKLVARG